MSSTHAAPPEDALIGSILDEPSLVDSHEARHAGGVAAASAGAAAVASLSPSSDGVEGAPHVASERLFLRPTPQSQPGPIQRSTSAPPQLHLEGLLDPSPGDADLAEPGQSAHAGFNSNPYGGGMGVGAGLSGGGGGGGGGGDPLIINGETIRADDQRLTPEYYQYYFSQKPLDPRLPPPLMNWSHWHPRHQTLNHMHAAAAAQQQQQQQQQHQPFDTTLGVADSPQLGSVQLGTSPADFTALDASTMGGDGTTTGANGGSVDTDGNTTDTFASFGGTRADAASSVSPGASSAASDELEKRLASISLARHNEQDNAAAVAAAYPPGVPAQPYSYYPPQAPQASPAEYNHPAALAAAAYYSQQQHQQHQQHQHQQHQQNQNYNQAYRGGPGGVNPLLAMMTYQQLMQQAAAAAAASSGATPLLSRGGSGGAAGFAPQQPLLQMQPPGAGPSQADMQAAMSMYAQMGVRGAGGPPDYRQAYVQQVYNGRGGGVHGRSHEYGHARQQQQQQHQPDSRYGGHARHEHGGRGHRHHQHGGGAAAAAAASFHQHMPMDGSLLGSPAAHHPQSHTHGHAVAAHGHGHGHASSHGPSLVAHSWLDEFRASKSSTSHTLHEVVARGLLVELAMDQHGSRFIQQRLEVADADEQGVACAAILPDLVRLSHDVFGNYVIQKFLEHAPSHEQRRAMCQALRGHVLMLTLQMYGCRVIQKCLDVTVADPETQAWLVSELDGHVMQCVRDQNGNHVIQKCIERVPSHLVEFIVDVFHRQIFALAIHPYGCRVIQRLLEHCTDAQRKSVLDEIIENVDELCRNQYGNYVTQHILKHGSTWHKQAILAVITGVPIAADAGNGTSTTGASSSPAAAASAAATPASASPSSVHVGASKVLQMAKHKYASNVVEKCFTHAGPRERMDLIDQILGPDANETGQTNGNTAATNPNENSATNSTFLAMVKDQYGNYVIQKMLDESSPSERATMISRIRKFGPNLRKIPYGKHIIAKIEKITNQTFVIEEETAGIAHAHTQDTNSTHDKHDAPTQPTPPHHQQHEHTQTTPAPTQVQTTQRR